MTEAWAEFGQALADALPTLPAGSALDLILDPSASGVGEAVYGVTVVPVDDGRCAPTRSATRMLAPEHRLSRTAVGELVALGWSPPGVVAGWDERFG